MNDKLKGIKRTIPSGGKTYRKEILLNKDNINGNCPYCNKYVSFVWIVPYIDIKNYPVYSKSNDGGMLYINDNNSWSICECPSCKECILSKFDKTEFNALGIANLINIYPNPLPVPSDESIPENIRKDFDEAKMCFSVDCYNAAAVMLRRSLEKMLIDQGSNKDTIFKQINELIKKGILTKNLEEVAKNLRVLGNYGAHDKSIEITKEDIEQGFQLTNHLFNFFYITPVNCKKIEKKFKRER